MGATDRTKEYLDYKNISKYQFYKKTGFSNKFLDNSNNMGTNKAEIILHHYPDINPEWLITGVGSMLKGSDNKNPGYNKNIHIPLVAEEAIMGYGNSAFSISENDIQAYYQVPDFDGIDFMIRVKGNSMYPKYSSGDVIACKVLHERNFIQWNKPHLISTQEQGLIVKRLRKSDKKGHLKAISDNKDYDAFDIPESDITGIAIIVGVIRLE